jgi:Domain of unknown function (DUF5655)
MLLCGRDPHVPAGHQCYHCKQFIPKGQAHDCWTTTEAALTRDLPEDLKDAWERLRESAVEFGKQRIYASHHSIMFSRKVCYFFVRPNRKYLEVVFFLGRQIASSLIRKIHEASNTKQAHVLRVIHRDQVEAPITDWLREAYEYADPDTKVTDAPEPNPRSKPRRASARRRIRPRKRR